MNIQEYKICQKRGHGIGNGYSVGDQPLQIVCGYCGVTYFHEPEKLVEVQPASV